MLLYLSKSLPKGILRESNPFLKLSKQKKYYLHSSPRKAFHKNTTCHRCQKKKNKLKVRGAETTKDRIGSYDSQCRKCGNPDLPIELSKGPQNVKNCSTSDTENGAAYTYYVPNSRLISIPRGFLDTNCRKQVLAKFAKHTHKKT